MKLPAVLFTASLLLNATLLVLLTLSSSGELPRFASSRASASSAGSVGQHTSNSTHAESPSTAQLTLDDHHALHDRLRALGLPESTVHAMIRAAIWQPYYDRQRALLASKNADDAPYWRSLPPSGSRAYTREERAELRALAGDLRQKIASVLGTAALDATGTRAQRYAFLPPDTAEKLVDLDRDYGEMRQEISQESARFRVPSDAEKTKFLDQERRKDLEALLTPSQLLEYDLRNSPAAFALRRRLSGIEVTEDEYRDLFDLQKALQDSAASRPAIRRTSEGLSPEALAELKARTSSYEAIADEMHVILGDDRNALFRRAGDNDYRQLQVAADRFNLPVAAIDEVYNLRDSVSTESQRIAADQALTPDQKKQALAALASQTRDQVTARLGSEVATAYLEKNMQWLGRVQNGSSVTFDPRGSRIIFKRVTPPPRPTAPRERPTASPSN